VNVFDSGRLRRFMKALGKAGYLEDYLLVVFSDHGEAPCRENFCHAGELLDGVIRVPLICASPGRIPEGKRIGEQVRLVDIFPTVLEACGIENVPEYALDGRSLYPLLRGRREPEREAYSEVWRRNPHESPASDRDHQPTMIQKSLRLSGKKAVECGHDFPAPALPHDELDDNAFVKAMYRKILKRVEDAEGLANYSKLLSNQVISREQLVDALRQSEEGRNVHCLFDVEQDPFERDNLLLGKSAEAHEETFKAMWERMRKICEMGEGRAGKSIEFAGEKERQRVMQQLESLGYFG
jgi:hypothetical protein